MIGFRRPIWPLSSETRLASNADCSTGVKMGKGRFLNQKLGKRTSRKLQMLKAGLQGRARASHTLSKSLRLPKKGTSRSTKF